MAEYEQKRKKLVAGGIVAVSAATAIGILGSKLHKTHKQLDELQGEYEKSIKTLKENTKEISKLNNELETAYTYNVAAEAIIDEKNDRIHDLTDRNEALIKIARKDRNDVKDVADRMIARANAVKAKHGDKSYRSKLYNKTSSSGLYNSIDKCNNHVDSELRYDIIKSMNRIISDAVSLGGNDDLIS